MANRHGSPRPGSRRPRLVQDHDAADADMRSARTHQELLPALRLPERSLRSFERPNSLRIPPCRRALRQRPSAAVRGRPTRPCRKNLRGHDSQRAMTTFSSTVRPGHSPWRWKVRIRACARWTWGARAHQRPPSEKEVPLAGSLNPESSRSRVLARAVRADETGHLAQRGPPTSSWHGQDASEALVNQEQASAQRRRGDRSLGA